MTEMIKVETAERQQTAAAAPTDIETSADADLREK